MLTVHPGQRGRAWLVVGQHHEGGDDEQSVKRVAILAIPDVRIPVAKQLQVGYR